LGFLKGQVMKEKGKRMTVKRVIEYPHMDGHTNYKLANTGEIPAMKIGAAWRFKKNLSVA